VHEIFTNVFSCRPHNCIRECIRTCWFLSSMQYYNWWGCIAPSTCSCFFTRASYYLFGSNIPGRFDCQIICNLVGIRCYVSMSQTISLYRFLETLRRDQSRTGLCPVARGRDRATPDAPARHSKLLFFLCSEKPSLSQCRGGSGV
jgi:hypothetical protein